jgi:hypothetical protein
VSKANHIRRGDITRRIQATLVMSPEAAVNLGVGLQQNAQKALQARKRKGKENV